MEFTAEREVHENEVRDEKRGNLRVAEKDQIKGEDCMRKRVTIDNYLFFLLFLLEKKAIKLCCCSCCCWLISLILELGEMGLS